MSKGRYLILKGCAGLGNRMYTLSRAIQYAELNNRKIYIDWSDGQFDKKGVNPFYDYFEIDSSVPQFEVAEIEKQFSVFPKLYKNALKASIYDLYIQVNRMNDISLKDKFLHKLAKAFGLKYGEKLFGYWHPISHVGELSKKQRLIGVFNKASFPFGANIKKEVKEDVVVYADFSPKPDEGILKTKLHLKKDLQKKISEKEKKLNLSKSCVGVHVRYTDKRPTKTLEILLERCKKEVKEGKRIFLATDNVDIEKRFQVQLGESLVINPKLMPENSSQDGLHRWAYNDDAKAGLLRKMFEESIEDMWLLSMCENLFYQGNSSFSVFSSIMSKNISEDWLKFRTK